MKFVHVYLFCCVNLFLLPFSLGFTPGQIDFELNGIPETWEGFANGMVMPRESPTSVVDLEFSAVADSLCHSILYSDTTSKDDESVLLLNYDGWVLDMWIQHSNALWHCVNAEGVVDGENLRIHNYKSASSRYVIKADYVPNSKGEYFFNSTLTIVPMAPDVDKVIDDCLDRGETCFKGTQCCSDRCSSWNSIIWTCA